MSKFKVDGQDVTSREDALLQKLIDSDPGHKFNDGNNVIEKEEARSLMDRGSSKEYLKAASSLHARSIAALTNDEYFELADAFKNKFVEGFPIYRGTFYYASDLKGKLTSPSPEDVPIFFDNSCDIKSRAKEVIDLTAGPGKIEKIKMSEGVFRLMKNAFNRETEVGFWIFANKQTGVIELAIRMTSDENASKRSIPYDDEEMAFYKYILEKKGYSFVGKYHSHTRSQAEVDADDNAHVTYPVPRSPSFLSKSDWSERDKPKKMDQIQLLGSVPEQSYAIDAYLINPQSYFQETPWRVDEGRFVKHYQSCLNHQHYRLDVQLTDTMTDPAGQEMLKGSTPFREVSSRKISYEEYRSLIKGVGDYFIPDYPTSSSELELRLERKWNGSGTIKVVAKDSGKARTVFGVVAQWHYETSTPGYQCEDHPIPFMEYQLIVDGSRKKEVIIKPGEFEYLQRFLDALRVPSQYVFDLP